MSSVSSVVSICLILLFTLICFYPLAFTDHILARGDTYSYHYPYWAARNAALTAGRLPLWSPDVFMGVPLLANPQIGTFYPPNWIVAPLSPPEGVRLSALLHLTWAGLGAYALARRALRVGAWAALAGAVLFALGGYVGARVEQINQLQGLAWLPWLLAIFWWALDRPFPRAAVLGIALALQFLTGHTQTVFMSLLALGIVAVLTRPLRGVAILAAGGVIALVLSLPQLIPTLELMSLSNRSGGFNLNQATAFSLNPFIVGRGLLPSYDGAIFSEYIAYIGVIGVGLALFGIGAKELPNAKTQSSKDAKQSRGFAPVRLGVDVVRWLARSPFAVLCTLGVFLALGEFNPLYWLLAGLPGFNLFRVPARWLALFALGAAMLAGRGFQRVLGGERPTLRTGIAALVLIGGLAISTALTGRIDDGTPAPPPTAVSVIGWMIAVGVLAICLFRPRPRWLIAALLLEVFLAGRVLPAQHLVPPEAFESRRFTAAQLLALNEGQHPPARFLSISDGLFDPGDRAALETRWFDLSPDSLHNAFVTVKQRELIAPNLPLLYGIPTIDGFDGGLLPTRHYTAFTSLLLPAGELRTLDGRLRESMASAACRGACIPDQRWLSLTNTRWLILDKVYDQVYDGVFYDTGLPVDLAANASTRWQTETPFETTEIHVVYRCAVEPCRPPLLSAEGRADGVPFEPLTTLEGGAQVARVALAQAQALSSAAIRADDAITVEAITLVDARTRDFQPLTPEGWRRVLSSDVKLYENLHVLPRAFMVYAAQWTPDSDAGTETALAIMRDSGFDPAQTVVLAGDGENMSATGQPAEHTVTIREYAPERVVIDVTTTADGYLLLTDAYYPAWSALLDGAPVPLYRANVMFRAVYVPAGLHQIVYTYDR